MSSNVSTYTSVHDAEQLIAEAHTAVDPNVKNHAWVSFREPRGGALVTFHFDDETLAKAVAEGFNSAIAAYQAAQSSTDQ